MTQNELLNTLKKIDEDKSTIKKQDVSSKVGNSIELMFNRPDVRAKFEKVLNERSNQFVASVLSIVKSDALLSGCSPMSVVSSAMQAAILDLPIDKNLGYAYIIPYTNEKKGISEAQLQISYKGYIQLALRSKQYVKMNAIPIYDGELISFNRLTEDLVLDYEKKRSEEIIGYAAYFELKDGFKKTSYWTKEQVKEYAEKHSKSYQKGNKIWQKDFNAMACKTVLKPILTRYGILSIEMQQAIKKDIDMINDDIENYDNYNDNDTIILNAEDFEVVDNDNL